MHEAGHAVVALTNYFAAVDVEAESHDVKWLSKMTDVLHANSREGRNKSSEGAS
jgi:hypothetical protein